MKHKTVFLLGILIISVILSGCQNDNVQMYVKEEEESSNTIQSTQEQADYEEKIENEQEPQQIYVYVCGYVNCPGVYVLDAQARICDAVKLAGGISEDGVAEALNQAEHMKDGQTIYIPGREEWESSSYMASSGMQEDDKININTASKEVLMTLPGIGESKANAIIEYRSAHGKFQSVEELMEIPGIKEGVYDKIQSLIAAF